MRGKRQRAEQRNNGAIADIQSAGESAEGGENRAASIGRKTAAAHAAAAARNTRQRMQMTGDFAIARRRRPMAKRQSTHRQTLDEGAADILRWIGIVIARDPDPIPATLQSPQRAAVGVIHARRSAAVMEAVTERDHRSRRVARDKPRQAG